MKELLLRFLRKGQRDTPGHSPPREEQLSKINPKDDFKLRVSRLRQEATARHMQGGDTDLEQTKMELVAMVMTINREDHDVSRGKISRAIGLSQEDYDLAEAAILEPDKLFAILPSWLTLFGYDEENFMEDLDAKAHIAMEHRRNISSSE